MNNNLQNLAIDAALKSLWDEAISLNKKILRENKNDLMALNRLAHAFELKGMAQKAQTLYRKVLKLDPCNQIALRRLNKLKEFNCRSSKGKKKIKFYNPSVFLEEPGKTKLISLVKIGTKNILSKLNPGDFLIISPKSHSISLLTCENEYVGAMPDDISFRLLDFLKKGNIYEAYIKSVSKNTISVFIKEMSRGDKLKNIPSFPIRRESVSNLTEKEIYKDEIPSTPRPDTEEAEEI